MKSTLSIVVCWFLVMPTISLGFSGTYFYELYLHNEYYSEPPGFPSKYVAAPIISWFDGKGDGWQENRFSVGIIQALRLTHNQAWIEFITSFGNEKVRFDHAGLKGHASRRGWDDFLIDIGYNVLDETGKKQLILHWLTGIPVDKKITLDEVVEPLWGSRTLATGPVIELAYDMVRNTKNDLFLGLIGRFLHRYKRHYEPILPASAFFKPGNQLDILALIHYREYEQNIEVGYVYTLFNHIAYQFIDSSQRLAAARYHSVYLDYFYYYPKWSMGFEANITKTFGTPSCGISLYGGITCYF